MKSKLTYEEASVIEYIRANGPHDLEPSEYEVFLELINSGVLSVQNGQCKLTSFGEKLWNLED